MPDLRVLVLVLVECEEQQLVLEARFGLETPKSVLLLNAELVVADFLVVEVDTEPPGLLCGVSECREDEECKREGNSESHDELSVI